MAATAGTTRSTSKNILESMTSVRELESWLLWGGCSGHLHSVSLWPGLFTVKYGSQFLNWNL